jgi:hypothetical protein
VNIQAGKSIEKQNLKLSGLVEISKTERRKSDAESAEQRIYV